MEPPFPVVSPCVFLDQPLGLGKAREDIKEVEAMPSHIALPLRFIPCIPHDLMYAHTVSTCQVRVMESYPRSTLCCPYSNLSI